jgi:hypothetical protein
MASVPADGSHRSNQSASRRSVPNAVFRETSSLCSIVGSYVDFWMPASWPSKLENMRATF